MRKKAFLILICVLFCASVLTACAQQEEPVGYDNIGELSDAVGFDVIEPSGMPEGYALAGYYAVGTGLAQILYVNGDKELIFAMTALKKVACETDEFEQTKTVGVNGVNFEYSLSGGSVRLATARVGDYTYAIYVKSGLSEEEMKQAVIGLGLLPVS